MSASSLLREYGLVGALDSMANMCGEQLAIIMELVPESPEYDDEAPQETEEVEAGELGWEAKGVTYFELQQNSIFLSNQMYMRLGVRPSDHVLIFGQGSTAAELTAILACMRLQAVFVPCNISSPSVNGEVSADSTSQLQNIIRDASPMSAIVVGENDESSIVRFLASQGIYRYSLINRNGSIVEEDPSAYYSSFQTTNNLTNADIEVYDGEDENAIQDVLEERNPLEQEAKPPTPLYILYTSGSTGVRKGVIGTHHGLINRLEYQYAKFPYNFNEVAVRRTPLTFVDAMVEIFAPVIAGVPICGYLFDRINQEGVISIRKECGLLGITRLTLIPSQLYQWCSQLLRENAVENSRSDIREEENPWSSITHVFVSGEECSFSIVSLFQACFPQATLVNMYGTTEISGDVTASVLCVGTTQSLNPIISQTLSKEELKPIVPIGTCMEGNYLFLLIGNDMEEVKVATNILNEDGELLVIGEHVSLGYYSPSIALDHRFVANPFLISDDEDQETINAMVQVLLPYVKVVGYAQDTCDNIDNTDDQQRATMLLARLQQYPTAFRTGDIAYYFHYEESPFFEKKKGNGEWVWVGRKDHVIKHHGQKVVLNALESKLHQVISPLLISQIEAKNEHENQTPLIVLSLTQDGAKNVTSATMLVAVILSSALRPDVTLTSIKSLINTSTMLAMHEKPTLVLSYGDSDNFPVTSSFKIDRAAVKKKIELFLSTSLAANSVDDSSMLMNHIIKDEISKDEIENDLWQIISSLLQLSLEEKKQVSASFFELGGDSIGAIELLWHLRHKYASNFHSFVLTPEHLHLSIEELVGVIFRQQHVDGVSNKRNLDTYKEDSASKYENQPTKRVKKGAIEFHHSHNIYATSGTIPQTWTNVINRCGTTVVSLPEWQQTSFVQDHLLSLHHRWQYKLLKCIDASPTVIFSSSSSSPVHVAGVVVGCHGGDIAWIDAHTGSPLWHIHLQSSSRATDHIESAAVIDLSSQTLFLTSFLGNDVHASSTHATLEVDDATDNNKKGCVWAIEVNTGHIKWSQPVVGECKASALLLSTISCVLIGDYLGHVYVIDTVSGKIMGEMRGLNGAIYATPQLLSHVKLHDCVILEVLVCTTRGSLYGIKIERTKNTEIGTSIAWQYHLETSCIFSTPSIIPDHSKILHGQDKNISFDWKGIFLACTDGSLRYLQQVADNNSSIPLRVAWESEEMGMQGAPFFSSPCYVVTMNEGFVVLGNHDGILRAVSVNDGHILAEYDLQSVLFASPSVIKLISSVDVQECDSYLVIVATTAGEVCLLRLTHSSNTDNDHNFNHDEVHIEDKIIDNNENWQFELCGKHKLPAEIFSSPVVMAPVTPATRETLAKIWIGCRDDCLHALDISFND